MAKRTMTTKSAPRKRSKSSSTRKTSTVTKLVRELLATHEHKYIDTYATNTDMISGGTLVCFNQVAEGSDFNQRIGRKIKGRYIQYDIYITPTESSNQAITHWIWHLVVDRQANTTIPGYNGVFDQTVITSGPGSFKNIASGDERFMILKSVPGAVSNQVVASAIPSQNFTENIHLRGFLKFEEDVQYNASSSGVPQTNALYLGFASNETSTADLYINYALRFVYVDA